MSAYHFEQSVKCYEDGDMTIMSAYHFEQSVKCYEDGDMTIMSACHFACSRASMSCCFTSKRTRIA